MEEYRLVKELCRQVDQKTGAGIKATSEKLITIYTDRAGHDMPLRDRCHKAEE